ncbi:MAG: nicotinamide nucleotide transhydrogenase, subunit alpha [Actinobacteria bacterium]|jgi:NAD(P) transhydrogenase subunit alpha|nr:nicotinamide nucleotide transhydrogenase, subunit alpha [Actinomycetota bacterium]MEA2502046.1 H+-translocating transhydrogenase subunit alpha [Actinomycetota bacterium]MEA2504391.1 H+-translocating transhydrogenase subunit alpha [Actinomycetota bacterium]MEA2534274.1 H+-translocating transhydrogenase subunit alpha [Actinomycetota bacterium]MEA2591476.1 H+-translocating transhydrogenase subunit alpha [Actinomycetota bacterium]
MSNNLTIYILIFMLATFLGLEVIKRVSPLLHTPLMSLTNAISAISLIGSIELTGTHYHDHLAVTLGTIAITASFANVVGGFVITDRMLKMFKKREPAKTGAGTRGAA